MTGPVTRRLTHEWPTVALAILIHGAWMALTALHQHLPTVLLLPALAIVVAWHSSLQHEVIHGHPFPNRTVDDALGSLPLSLWVPYGRYRDLHLRHHRDEHLTDPVEDPESYYVTGENWATMGRLRRALVIANRTLLGRMVLGTLVSTVTFWWRDAKLIATGDRRVRAQWLAHLVGLALVIEWLVGVCHLPLGLYLVAGFWGGRALASIRSFLEHRWVADGQSRSAVVRAGRFFSLLFLHNNLHHAHHNRPGAPWYELPALADALGSDAAAADGAGWYRGYREVARRYLVRPFDVPVHPRYPVPATTATATTGTRTARA